MKDEILDEQAPNDFPKYGIKSFYQFLYSILIIFVIVCFILFFGLPIIGGTPGRVSKMFILIFPLLLLLPAFIPNMLGLNNALESRKRNERLIVLGIFFFLLFLVFLWLFI